MGKIEWDDDPHTSEPLWDAASPKLTAGNAATGADRA